MLKHSPRTYRQADATLGDREKLVAGNNTVLKRDGDDIFLMYHGHPIVCYEVVGTEDAPRYSTGLSACGWKTYTTKERLNQILPNGYILFQRKHEWYLSHIDEDGHRTENVWNDPVVFIYDENGDVRLVLN